MTLFFVESAFQMLWLNTMKIIRYLDGLMISSTFIFDGYINNSLHYTYHHYFWDKTCYENTNPESFTVTNFIRKYPIMIPYI